MTLTSGSVDSVKQIALSDEGGPHPGLGGPEQNRRQRKENSPSLPDLFSWHIGLHLTVDWLTPASWAFRHRLEPGHQLSWSRWQTADSCRSYVYDLLWELCLRNPDSYPLLHLQPVSLVLWSLCLSEGHLFHPTLTSVQAVSSERLYIIVEWN